MAKRKLTEADLVDCFHVPGTPNIIDMVHPNTGRGAYGGRTLEEIREEYPGAVVVNFETANAEKDAYYVRAPERITKERFWEMLEVLPPDDWRHHGGGESFKMSERWSGEITSIFVRIGADYYELRNRVTLPHLDILALCLEAAQGKVTTYSDGSNRVHSDGSVSSILAAIAEYELKGPDLGELGVQLLACAKNLREELELRKAEPWRM